MLTYTQSQNFGNEIVLDILKDNVIEKVEIGKITISSLF